MMKPIETLLRQLNQLDIHLWLEEGHLRYNAPKGKLTAALREEIARSAEETSKGLECKFRYNTDLFEETSIKWKCIKRMSERIM